MDENRTERTPRQRNKSLSLLRSHQRSAKSRRMNRSETSPPKPLFEDTTGDFELIVEPVASEDHVLVPTTANLVGTQSERRTRSNCSEEPEKWDEDDDNEAKRIENVRKRWQPYDYEAELFGGSDFDEEIAMEGDAEKPTKRPADNEESTEIASKKKLKFEETYLRSIPRSSQYEKSFMHRDTITRVLTTSRDFIITASQDGHLKFWKKKHGQIEFVKHFRCHLKEFSDIVLNHNGMLMATCGKDDQTIKVFDVVNFDMINMVKLDFFPSVLCWVHTGSDLDHALAIADAGSPRIKIVDGKGSTGEESLKILDSLHTKPVVVMEYCSARNVTISVDEMGMIEYWSGSKTNYEFPKNVGWEFKTDTELYEFVKTKQVPKCLTISPDGRTFTVISSDRFIYVYDLWLAKITRKLDESLSRYIQLGKENKCFGIPNMEWNRRIATEKEINRDPNGLRFVKVIYDESGNFIIYPTPIGIAVFNLVTNEIVRDIGKGENIRFTGLALCRAVPTVGEKMEGAATSADVEAAENPNLKASDPEPMLIACAHRRNRFYIFTNVEPYSTDEDADAPNRDIFNEKPTKEDTITAVENDTKKTQLSDKATIHTSFGDIHIELYPDKCPKTVENFCTHARRGYYNGLTFHRVIKAFMIQTGDPTGKGTGGQSIWGDDFEDEIHPSLRYDKPYRLAMANAGPNTNGSQFFITVVPADWLDGRHTLFGQVTEGYNVVQKISQTPTFERSGRPRQEISIVSISIKNAEK